MSNRKRTRRPSQAEPWKAEFLLTGQVKKADGSKSSKPYLWLAEYNGCFAATVQPRNPGESDADYLKRHGITPAP
jgi:hypothetical protein